MRYNNNTNNREENIMAKERRRIFRMDDDTVEVTFVFDNESGIYLGEFPDFAEEPRYTPSGKPWVNVTNDSCQYAENEYSDCGSCRFFSCEKSGDLIGICENELLRKGENK